MNDDHDVSPPKAFRSSPLTCALAVAAVLTALGAVAAAPDGHGHSHGEPPKAAPAASAGGPAEQDGHKHGAGDDEVKLTEDAVRRSGIRVAVAREQKLSAVIGAPARVAFNAEAMAHVGSQVHGRARELRVKIGDTVKKGDVLAVVDSPELGEAQSDYLQKRTAVENLGPVTDLTRAAYERAQTIFDENQGVSLTEVQTRQREFRTAQGELASARTALLAAGNRLLLLGMDEEAVKSLAETQRISPTYVVRAPIDGAVIRREVTLGELVGPDKEVLFVLADLRTLWVLVDVPEAQSGAVASGQPVQIAVIALAGQAVNGTVSYVSPELDPSTRTARVRVLVDNGAGLLRSGMFARAEITAGTGSEGAVVAVPDDAVQTVEGEPAVFVPVEGEPNTFAKRAVGVGPAVGGMVPVFAGLKAGDRYVVAGSFVLKAELGKAGAAHQH